MSESDPPGAPADLAAEPVHVFLSMLASGAPAPGGGAAAALCGALAAALVAMVGRVTGERDSSLRGEMRAIVERADALRGRLAALVTEDADAYRRVIAARRAGGRPPVVQGALVGATEVPVMLARSCREVLALCATAGRQARPSTLADLEVAAVTAWGALESAAITARANLAGVADEALVRASEAELAALLAEGREARHRVSGAIEARVKRPPKV